MPRFRKVSFELEAEQFLGLMDAPGARPRFTAWPDWLVAAEREGVVRPDPEQGSIIIKTKEGHLRARPGAWVVQGVAGELYPVDEELFPKLYAPVAL